MANFQEIDKVDKQCFSAVYLRGREKTAMPRRTRARVDDLVSTKEAAEILSRTHGRPISESFVRRLSYEGRLTKVPLDGRTPRYIRKEVEALRLRDQPGRP